MIVFCAILVVSQLVRLSDMLVNFGLSLENVFLPFLYIILPFLSLTIPMSYLFAVVLTFGRLSADGEYPALLAAGYSLRRAALPVLLVGGVLYGVATGCAMYLEAWGRREMVQFLSRKTQTELDNMIKYKMQSGVFLDDFLGYVIYAEKISEDRSSFENLLLAPGKASRNGDFALMAPSGAISGSVETGNLRLTLDFGVAYSTRDGTDRTGILKFNKAEVDLLKIFHQQILGADSAEDDYRSYTPQELSAYVDALAVNPERDDATFYKARYLYHKRIGSPFAVITFALFGMVLGISDPRRGKSIAYVGAIGTIIGGFVMMSAFGWLAEHGHLGPALAAWIPNLLLLVFGGFLVYQKNRLPPSENPLDWANMPFRDRFKSPSPPTD
jgi:lipopolysaccharide export system permease protein